VTSLDTSVGKEGMFCSIVGVLIDDLNRKRRGFGLIQSNLRSWGGKGGLLLREKRGG